jgi:cytochrome b involved in lipid metabolism
LTAYISRHPGGAKNILRICGKDGTSTFEGQHGGESRPERTLEGYFIGSLN